MSFVNFETLTAEGQVTVNHFETGRAYWSEPDPTGQMHRDLNDTEKNIEVIVVEMK